MSQLIQRLVIDHLHIVGDIFDRGPGPHKIMDKLMSYHSVDIQWGNHDVLWMGAAAGSRAALPMSSVSVPATETWIFWRMATASTCCPLPPSP